MIASERCLSVEEVRFLSEAVGERPLVPWEQNRFRLYTPFDMIRFYAGMALVHTREITGEIHLLEVRIMAGDGDKALSSKYMDTHKNGIIKTLNGILHYSHEMPLSPVLRSKIERLLKWVQADDETLTAVRAEMLLKELHNDILVEMSSPYFLMIPVARRALYEQVQPVFGPEVHNRFPEIAYDIAAAGRCIALDEWTAAVFHLMRVLEKGLHNLADHLQISMGSNVEFENWKNIIDQIEAKIRELEQLPKGPTKSETLQRYAQIASNFWYFKEAWRNHVSHSRAIYDERMALDAFNHVRAFMQELAKATS